MAIIQRIEREDVVDADGKRIPLGRTGGFIQVVRGYLADSDEPFEIPLEFEETVYEAFHNREDFDPNDIKPVRRRGSRAAAQAQAPVSGLQVGDDGDDGD